MVGAPNTTAANCPIGRNAHKQHSNLEGVDVNIKLLNRFVKMAERLVIRSPSLPILGHVLFEKGSMRVTDLENTLMMPIDDKRPYTIPFTALKTVLKQSLQDLNIELGKAHKVILSYDNKSLSVQGLDPADFPIVPKGKFKMIDEWNANRISALLTHLPFISKEELRPALTGVLLDYDGSIKSVSTDGHLMRVMNRGKGNGIKTTKILPTKALKVLSLAPLQPVEVFSSESHALFKRKDGIILYSRWIGEAYPDYKPFVEDWKLKGHAIFDVKELLKSISDSKPFVNSTTKGIRLNLNKNRLDLISDDPENKSSFIVSVSTSTNLNRQNFEAGFNANYLEVILKSISTEKVIWRFNEPNEKTFWLDDVEEPDVVNLIMPIRLEDKK